MKFEVTPSLEPDDRKLIREGVITLIERHFKLDIQPLGVVARDEQGTLVGGIAGHSVASWLSIDLIWVAEPYRRHGIGRKLMELAEAAAAERGCVGVHAHTGSFEAPWFYERLGFARYGIIEDFPPGHQRISFSKQLVQAAAGSP